MKTYECKCHVCGTDFQTQAHFLSSPRVTADGRPMFSCGKHNAAEIRAAYLRGLAA